MSYLLPLRELRSKGFGFRKDLLTAALNRSWRAAPKQGPACPGFRAERSVRPYKAGQLNSFHLRTSCREARKPQITVVSHQHGHTDFGMAFPTSFLQYPAESRQILSSLFPVLVSTSAGSQPGRQAQLRTGHPPPWSPTAV